jgi:rhamnosyltransferase
MENRNPNGFPGQPNQSVAVIYLAYHPDEKDLQYVNKLSSQLPVVVVSNSGTHDFGTHIKAAHFFDQNVGVGAGYNAGVSAARELGVSHVMFHDQDSRLDPSTLAEALDRLSHADPDGNSVALSLNPVDLGSGKVRTPRFTKPKSKGELFWHREVQFSGLVAPISLFTSSKPFSEYLFVDLVDFEWCWRVAPSIEILRDRSLQIGHSLGSGTRTLFGNEYTLPSSSRFYFQFRNLVALLGVRYVPTRWKLLTLTKYALRSALLPFIDTNWAESWKQSLLGIKSGLAASRGRVFETSRSAEA